MRAKVVIGANFGDEGKGLMTDYLSAKDGSSSNSLVIRFNGGAQAGHTVQLPDGNRHVFSHFASGSFAGAATYLSEYFIANPILFCNELNKIKKLGISPLVYLHPDAVITTPYDMIINQVIEDNRSNKRHGSCGVGIGETIERSLNTDYLITVKDLFDSTNLVEKLLAIKNTWCSKRLQQCGIKKIDPQTQLILGSDILLSNFLADIDYMLSKIEVSSGEIVSNYSNIIFEGAQGLLLDQTYGWFPHVTRSHTGLRNVVKIAQDLNIHELDIYYMSRAYFTRHGNGPLPNENLWNHLEKFEDKTNVEHLYQGKLRFAPLDIDLLYYSISQDLGHLPKHIKYTTNLVLTCMDHLNADVSFNINKRLESSPVDVFTNIIKTKFNNLMSNIYTSYGPTRETISLLPDCSYSQESAEPILQQVNQA